MKNLQVLFVADITKPPKTRFDDFIHWAEPFGAAHIDHIHHTSYKQSDPWFEYATGFLPHGHISSRSWFIKAEHLGEIGIFGRAKRPDGPEIYLPHSLIEDGQFLHFAKAYVNVMMHLRQLRSAPKSMILALCFLEREIRILNGGRNAPSLLSHLAFVRTCKAVEKSLYGPSRQYDIGKDLEALAGMLQAGFHSKTFRYETEGFKLLDGPFVFSSPIPQAPRLRAIQTEEAEEDVKSIPSGRLSNESVVALGISFRRSAVELGRDHTATFVAALPGLALTTVSMRMSELLELHRDALYR